MAKASKEEINLNAEYFAKYNPKNEIERKLLKEAKELRLCFKLVIFRGANQSIINSLLL